MLKIRLRRVGKKHQPAYRVVVVEHTAPIQGSYLENLGTYNPRAHTFTVKQDRVLYWLDHGAQPSERMAKLLTKEGVAHKLISLPDYDRKPKRPPKKAPAAEAMAAPTTLPAAVEVPAVASVTQAETAQAEITPEAPEATEGGSTPQHDAAAAETAATTVDAVEESVNQE